MLHLIFWGGFLFLLMVMLGIYFRGNVPESRLAFYMELLCGFILVPSMTSFYLFYFGVFPNYLRQRKIALSIVYGIFSTLLAVTLGVLSLSFIRDVTPTFGICKKNSPDGLLVMFFVSLACGAIALILKGCLTWLEEIKLKDRLRQKNHEMELALIKAQLDPHFLFNTINNIDVLMLKNALEASKYLNKLSDIMRFMLFETKTDKIPLAHEIEYIQKYIELQKIRTSNSDYVNFEVIGNPQHQTIAPMAFISFIENAFKHTNNKKIKNAIDIVIKIEGDAISLVCKNKFDSSRKKQTKSNGIGNHLIQKRLNLIYQKKHQLNISNQKDLYQVFLRLQTVR